MRGKCDTKDVPGYLVAQLAAALFAGFLVLFMKGQPEITPMEFRSGPLIPLLAELFGTYALAYVILNVATAKSTEGNSYYGLAIGFTVTALAFSLGGYSGGAFNPAVAIGITAMGLGTISNIWIYFVANFSGAAAAAITFVYLNNGED